MSVGGVKIGGDAEKAVGLFRARRGDQEAQTPDAPLSVTVLRLADPIALREAAEAEEAARKAAFERAPLSRRQGPAGDARPGAAEGGRPVGGGPAREMTKEAARVEQQQQQEEEEEGEMEGRRRRRRRRGGEGGRRGRGAAAVRAFDEERRRRGAKPRLATGLATGHERAGRCARPHEFPARAGQVASVGDELGGGAGGKAGVSLAWSRRPSGRWRRRGAR